MNKLMKFIIFGALMAHQGFSWSMGEWSNEPEEFWIGSAAYKRDLGSVQCFVESGANVNEQNERGQTALMAAALIADLPIVQYLIKVGADVNLQNEDGWTALVWAIDNGSHDAVIDELLTGISAVDAEKFRALVFSLNESGMKDMVLPMTQIFIEQRLQRANQMMNIQDDEGEVAWMHARDTNDVKIAQLLNPSNQVSQQRIRQLIEEKVKILLSTGS